jgi:ketosteroid isomerase-like protein
MPFPREEVRATVDRYHQLRSRIDEGLESDAFGALADFYTEDAVYIDGAWGRLEGGDNIARWLVDSMLGMEDWKFPIEFTAIEGDDVVVKWTQIMPRTRPDGTPYRQSGYSRLIYAGNGKFSYEEDTYNMAHVLEDIEASGWQPQGGEMNLPPAHPDRNFDIPPGARRD